MRRKSSLAFTISLSIFAIGDTTRAADTVLVTPDNFVRAESDLYFGAVALKDKALGRFQHNRGFEPLDDQKVIRANRDTLYSVAVFDLDAGPVTLIMPDAGDRFMSLQIFDEDQYTLAVHYGKGSYTLDKTNVSTRYVMAAVRTLVDPTSEDDLAKGYALQDGVRVDQKSSGSFDVPRWDSVSQAKVRAALLDLASTLPDTKGMFGSKDQVDPVRRLIGAASAWGGNPENEALYLNVTPPKNDGKTIYKLDVKDVPVDGFWSISFYNSKGYYEENQYGAYTLNNLTAKRNADGSAAFMRQRLHPLAKVTVVAAARFITDRHPAKADGFTRPPFTHLVAIHQMSDSFPLCCGRHHFFPKRSFKAALSSIASASSRFSFVFSSSSDFSRLASDTSMPPNSAFHL